MSNDARLLSHPGELFQGRSNDNLSWQVHCCCHYHYVHHAQRIQICGGRQAGEVQWLVQHHHHHLVVIVVSFGGLSLDDIRRGLLRSYLSSFSISTSLRVGMCATAVRWVTCLGLLLFAFRLTITGSTFLNACSAKSVLALEYLGPVWSGAAR